MSNHGEFASPRLFYFASLTLAIALWLLCVGSTTIYRFSPDVYHYVRALPWSYWISLSLGLGVLGVRFLYPDNFNKTATFDIVIMLIFTLFLFGTPSFIEDMPRFFDAYEHTGSALLVKLSGKTGPALSALSAPSFLYPLNYPGFFTFLASFLTITGLPWMPVLKYYPFPLMAMIALLIYTIAKIFTTRYSLMAPIFFLSFAWFQAFHVSPESFAFILYLVIWLGMTKLYVASNKTSVRRSLSLLVLLVVFSVVVSHMGSLIFLILNLALLLVLTYIPKLTKFYMFPANILGVLATTVILFFGWLSFVAQFSFTSTVESISQAVVNILTGGAPSLKPAVWSYEYTIVNHLIELEVLVTNIVGAICVLLLSRNHPYRKGLVWLGGWLASCWIFLIYPLFSRGTYVERSAMFALIPISVLTSFSIKHFKRDNFRKIFIVTYILMVSFGFICLPLLRNANDSFETPSKSSLSAANFAVSNSNTSIAYARRNRALLGLYYRLNLMREDHYYLFDEKMSVQKFDLILFDDQAYATALNYGYEKEYRQTERFASEILPRIYDSETANLYVNPFELLNVTRRAQET